MSVTVSPITIASGGIARITRFQDTFNRASGDLGVNWIFATIPATPVVGNIYCPRAQIGADAGTQRLLLSPIGTGAQGTGYWGGGLCLPLTRSVSSQNQFAEMQVGATINLNTYSGPAVLINQSHLYGVGNDGQLIRADGPTSLVSLHAGFAVAAGDILRIEAVVTAPQVDLTVKKNGAVQYTVTDAGASRSTTGPPGFFSIMFAGGAGGSSAWEDFDGGLL